MSAQPPGGVIITGTWRVDETPETIRLWGDGADDYFQTQYIGALDTNNVVSVSDSYRNGQFEWRRVVAYNDAGRKEHRVDEHGIVLEQGGHQFHTELTEEVRRTCGFTAAEDLPATDPRIQSLIDYDRHPRVDWSLVRDLIAEELVTATVGASPIALPVVTLDARLEEAVYGPTSRIRSRVSVPDGLVLRYEEWWHDSSADPDMTFETEDFETGLVLGDAYFKPEYMNLPLDSPVRTDYLEAWPYEPQRGFDAPIAGSEHLLPPPTRPLLGRFELTASAFITGTMDSRRMEPLIGQWDGQFGQRHWSVVEQFDDEPIGKRLLVIQAPDAQHDPLLAIEDVWPPRWAGENPEILLDGMISGAAIGSFADGADYQAYDHTGWIEWRRLSNVHQFDQLITWLEPGGIRVAALTEGLSREEAVELAECFRDSAQHSMALSPVPQGG